MKLSGGCCLVHTPDFTVIGLLINHGEHMWLLDFPSGLGTGLTAAGQAFLTCHFAMTLANVLLKIWDAVCSHLSRGILSND